MFLKNSLSMAVAAAVGIAATGAFAAQVDPWGYQTIFDGTQASFQNWTYVGARGGFELPGDGTMRSFAGGLGALWYPQVYGDFELKLEWRDDSPVALSGNSGILVRFPTPSTGNLSCLNRPTCGYEIQINDSPDRDPKMTGSIYGFQDVSFEGANVTPKGTWNTYEVRVVGQHYTVIRNGQIISDYLSVPGVPFAGRPTDPGSSGRGLTGYVGLQAHGDANDVVSFRNIQIREFVSPVPEPASFLLAAGGLAFLATVVRRRA